MDKIKVYSNYKDLFVYDYDPLTKLAIKYKTDKWGKHHFTPYYYDLFKDRRESVKKVLEIGAGEGASLLMWQDFFPNAKIYSGEIDPNRCFTSNRIKIIQCDQSKLDDLINLVNKTGSDVDLVIDDGSHIPEHQVYTCLGLMYMLKDPIYIIEDVADSTIIEKLDMFNCKIVKLGKRYDDRLIIIKK